MSASLSALLKETAARLRGADARSRRAWVGFDGFIDEIIDVVDTREDPSTYRRISQMDGLARRIAAAAGLSTNIELVATQVKLGGNGPIMANALSRLGLGVTYTGAVGYPELHPVFRELADGCRVIPVSEPGRTLALEFDDGKVMLGLHQTLKDLRWERILASASLEELQRIASEADLIAALNWTMLPYLGEVWEGMLTEVLPALPPGRRPFAFFDLCDPAKRTPEDLRQAIRTIEQFNRSIPTVLGLNWKEATEVGRALGLDIGGDGGTTSLLDAVSTLGEALDLYAVVVHPTAEAAVAVSGSVLSLPGPYTKKPKLTTGAGDNFNAGFCLGLVLGFDPEACLALGKGASGFYVRNRRSPGKDELATFLEIWADHPEEEF